MFAATLLLLVACTVALPQADKPQIEEYPPYKPGKPQIEEKPQVEAEPEPEAEAEPEPDQETDSHAIKPETKPLPRPGTAQAVPLGPTPVGSAPPRIN